MAGERPFLAVCKKVAEMRKKDLHFQMASVILHLAHGGIAQLGERLNGIQEVSGSIPLISTKTEIRFCMKSPEIVRFQDFFSVFLAFLS